MKSRIVMYATLTLCFYLVLSVRSPAQTQSQEPGTDKAQKVSQILNLSPQQESQLTPILQTETPKIQAIKDDPSLSASEKKKKLKEIHEQNDRLIKPILTPIQYKQWEQIRKNELEQIK
jgi:flagellar motility protein MotE (MotC chaperone)